MSEQNLQYMGLSMPGLSGYEFPSQFGSDTGSTGSSSWLNSSTSAGTSSSTGGGAWVGDVSKILGALATAGMSASQIITAIKGNQPILFTNPETGQTQNVANQLQQQQQNMGEDKFMQMMAGNKANNPNPSGSGIDGKTMLYIGGGAVALIMLMMVMKN